MNTRDQFGAYLLLKKLSEDALGETFRAGRVARQTLERVVLLRVLNGTGFDAERIARSLQQRAELAKALKSPTIGGAVDVGQVRGVPYVAYDYSPGRSLAQLLEQAANRNTPLPLDHALLIAERIALGLAVAQETRIGDERVQHGFVTPQLVQVSNEGELKLVGFEASSGLRASATNPVVKQMVGRYLAPEALAGQPASRADDVWSAGAILLEMLTGQSVPSMPADALGGVIDQAQVAADGSAIPAELGALLKRSLAPREQRVPDIVAWHKSLAAWMSSAGQAATTFNLAFFLHSLFRDEIERESRELESEKTQAAALAASTPAPTPEPAKGAAAAAGSPARSSGPVREDTAVVREEYGIAPKKSNTPMIAGALGAIVVLGVGGWFVFGRGGDNTPQPPVQAPAAAAPAVVETPAPEPEVPAGPTPEEIQQQISQMITQQQKQLEAGLQARYEEQLRALQGQLAEAERARTASEQRAAQQAAAQQAAAQQAAALQPPKVEPEPRSEPAETARASAPQAAVPTPAPTRATTPEPIPAPQTARPAPTQPAPKPVAPVPQSGVRRGELVTMGPGVVPPRIVRPASLSYPPLAKRTKKEASVIVRVLVDENGDVIDTDIPGGKVGFGFDAAAISYARGSKWDPARKEGVEVKIWTEIKVDFKL